MKKLNVLAVTFLVFLSITMNAAALESKTITRQNSASAFGTSNYAGLLKSKYAFMI